MRNDCITFGEPDLEREDCRACWHNRPELFFSCLAAEYEQIRPKSYNEMDTADIGESS